jgi:hypothetical protein
MSLLRTIFVALEAILRSQPLRQHRTLWAFQSELNEAWYYALIKIAIMLYWIERNIMLIKLFTTIYPFLLSDVLYEDTNS